jgi:hypothetical protein
VQAHLEEVFTKDPTQIARFLQSLAPLGWTEGSATPRVSELGANHLKNIKLIIDLDAMAGWIRRHSTGNFDNPEWLHGDDRPLEQRLAEQFMFVYNKWKKDGEPPD